MPCLPASQCRASYRLAERENIRLRAVRDYFHLESAVPGYDTDTIWPASAAALRGHDPRRDRLYLTCSRGRASRFLSDVPREYLKRE